MAILNHFYTLTLPFVLLFTFPLLFFATITTLLAASLLTFRVLLVYAELAIAVVPYYLSPFPRTSISPSADSPYSTPYASTVASPTQRRRRRASSVSLSLYPSNLSSAITSSSITPVGSQVYLPSSYYTSNNNVPLKSSTSTTSIRSTNPLALSSTILNPYLTKSNSRDFEGVGGWRLDAPDDEDALWTKINSRLELPAEHGRRHRRSTTAGSVKLGREDTGERLESGMFESGSFSRSGSPETERGIVMKGRRSWDRERERERERVPEKEKELEKDRESNVGRARTPLESSGGYFGSVMMAGASNNVLGPPVSPKAAKRERNAHAIASTSSGSSKGSVPSVKRNNQ